MPEEATPPPAGEAAPAGDGGTAVPGGNGGGQPPADEEPSPGMPLLWLLILWFAIIYFFFMRPKQKKEKQRQEKISNVTKGDRVVTVGGIHGFVTKVDEKAITLRIDDKTGTTIKMSRGAISEINPHKQDEGAPTPS
jgi:preprotein translocase subunit YajC